MDCISQSSLGLGKSGGSKRVSLNGDFRLAVVALDGGQVSESFYPKDVTKISSVFDSAGWTWAVSDELSLEDELLGDDLCSVVHKGRTQKK